MNQKFFSEKSKQENSLEQLIQYHLSTSSHLKTLVREGGISRLLEFSIGRADRRQKQFSETIQKVTIWKL